MVVVTLVTFALCGHSIFSASGSSKTQTVTDTVAHASLPLSRERSTRGLSEQGVCNSIWRLYACAYMLAFLFFRGCTSSLTRCMSTDVVERIPSAPKELKPQVGHPHCPVGARNH